MRIGTASFPQASGGAGTMKLVSWSGGELYTAAYAADGSGTYDITSVTQVDLDLRKPGVIDTLPGGPEGFVYITAGNPGFVANAMLVSEFSAGNVVAAGRSPGSGVRFSIHGSRRWPTATCAW